MSGQGTQTITTHRRWVPMYHFVASSLLLLNLGYAVSILIRGVSFGNVVQVTTAFTLLVLFFYLRAFPIAVQDRLIRLEERLRMSQLFSDDMKTKTDEFGVRQMVGLRFASDAELPTLAKRVMDEGITNPEEIKKLIKEWRPDEVRA